MRRRSFVIDLEVPVPAGAEWVKIVPTWTPRTAGEDVTPRTRCTVSPTEFRAVPGPDAPDLEGGMLRLSADHSFEAVSRRYLAPDMLIIDDFGLRLLNQQQSAHHVASVSNPNEIPSGGTSRACTDRSSWVIAA